MKRHNHKGFTLVELMIVIAIISLLAAIAIPNLMRARISANEAASIGNLRTVSTACETFRPSQNPSRYPFNIFELTNSNPPYVDARWRTAGGGQGLQGYRYNFAFAANAYTITAVPVSAQTGVRQFTIDQTGVIVDQTGRPIQ
jgi:prepilin-type N-terminal cleavage/methylation domain-containing protein